MLMRYRGVRERTCSASFLEEFFSETQSGLLHQEEGPTHSPNVPPSPQEVLSLEPASATEPSAASSPRCAAISLAYACAPWSDRWILSSPEKYSGCTALAACQSTSTLFEYRCTPSVSTALLDSATGFSTPGGTVRLTIRTLGTLASTPIISSNCSAVKGPLLPMLMTTASAR